MEKKELINTLFEAMNTRDFSGLEEVLTEDAVFDFPGAGRIEGAKRIIIFLKALLRKYRELTFSIKDMIIEDDRACAIWINSGEHIEGYAYTNSGVTLFHFSADRIAFLSDYFKDTSFVK